MASSEPAGPHPSHIKAVGARVPRGKSSDLIPLTAGARAGTTPIHWARAPPGGRASAGHSSSASRLLDVI